MDSPDCMEVEDQEAVELLFNLAQVAPAATPAASSHANKRHKSLHGPKPVNKEAKETATGKRRGPMDDMRQVSPPSHCRYSKELLRCFHVHFIKADTFCAYSSMNVCSGELELINTAATH